MNNIEKVQKNKMTTDDILFSLYPELSQIEKTCWLKLLNHSQVLNLPPQTNMLAPLGPYEHFLLLLEGQSRVYEADENGREVTFYRNYPGDICPNNLQNLFNFKTTQNLIKAETAIHALQISSHAFHTIMQESEVFRDFIFSHMTQKFSELTVTLQNAVFQKLDSRLCNLLKDLFKQSEHNTLKITHQKLANELGTTREVISRSLKLLEKKGCLKITRGQLTITSPDKLTTL